MKKIALVFPGQGSQYPGMGKKLCDNHKDARDILEEASEVLGMDMKRLCFEGSREELANTQNTQVAVFAISMAMYCVYKKETGLDTYCMAGHSLGEYAALTAAGKIRFQDALKIVWARGQFMQEAADKKGGLMKGIIGLDAWHTEAICKKYQGEGRDVWVANYNSPLQNVIAGQETAVEDICREMEEAGAKIAELEVKAPFHCALMQEAAEKMTAYLKDVRFEETPVPVISNVKALPYADNKELHLYLPRQIVAPVRWRETMGYMEGLDIDTVIEIGPKAVLKKLAQYNIPAIAAYSYDLEPDAEIIKIEARNYYGARSGDVNWNRFIEMCIKSAICSKNRNYNEQEYEEGMVRPYKRIKNRYYDMKDRGEQADSEQAKAAYLMLIAALKTKKTSQEEQETIMDELFSGLYSDYQSMITG